MVGCLTGSVACTQPGLKLCMPLAWASVPECPLSAAPSVFGAIFGAVANEATISSCEAVSPPVAPVRRERGDRGLVVVSRVLRSVDRVDFRCDE
jgi:hypothetical protein